MCANANATLAATIIPSPLRTVLRTPKRAASQPDGSEPISVPAAYAAASTPAPDFARWKWCE